MPAWSAASAIYMGCVAVFTVSLAALRSCLESAIAHRFPHLAGRWAAAAWRRVEQSILADTFPPEQARAGLRALRHRRDYCPHHRADPRRLDHRQLFLALDLLHQHPVSASFRSAWCNGCWSSRRRSSSERRERLRGGLKIDWLGFVLVALFLGCLEIVLDRGQEDDWFGSSFIVIITLISAVSFVLCSCRGNWRARIRSWMCGFCSRRQFGTAFLVMLCGRRHSVRLDADSAAAVADQLRLQRLCSPVWL